MGILPDKKKKLSIGVGRRHPVTRPKTSLIGLLMRRVWALRHQTGEQYSAAECTRTRVAVHNVVAPAPQVDPANCLKNLIFLYRDGRCRRNVSALFSVMPKHVGSAQCGRARLSTLTESSHRASLPVR